MNNKLLSATILTCGFALLITSHTANAADCFGFVDGYCLKDGNAEFQIDSYGLMSLTVDNVNNIHDTEVVIAEHSTDPLILSPYPITFGPVNAGSYSGFGDLTQTQDDPTALSLSNMPIGQPTWGIVQLDFKLKGGDAGSHAASLIETFTVTNTSDSDIDLGIFSYIDADLGGGMGANDDQVQAWKFDDAGNPFAFRQWDAADEMIATFDKTPDYYLFDKNNGCILDVCEEVFFGVDTILANTINAGPADLAMAVQWNQVLSTGESFTLLNDWILMVALYPFLQPFGYLVAAY